MPIYIWYLTTTMCHSFFYFVLVSPRRTLNNNNITVLPRELFSGMPRIRALRLSDNPFTCDCHLSWLSRYLRNSPRLAPYTRCHSPSQLKGQSVAELHEQDFKCSGKWNWVEFTLIRSICRLYCQFASNHKQSSIKKWNYLFVIKMQLQ